jgi:hypothetical protein
MSTTENNPTVSAAHDYRERMFRLLGERDPLDVISQTATKLADIVNNHSAVMLRARPFEGKWTPNEIIGHLSDGEWVYGYRLRLILCEHNPTILGTHQDSWVQTLRHNDREPSDLLEIFRTLRQLNLALWRRTSQSDLKRCGEHNERGCESLGTMLQLLAGHDLSHLDQIARCLEASRL